MADAFEPLETERLILRRFEARDLEPFLAYRQDRDVAWFQGWSLDFSRQDAEAFIEEQSKVEPGAPFAGFSWTATPIGRTSALSFFAETM